MEQDNGQGTDKSSRSPVPRLPKSYNFLIQLSKKLGTVATKSSIINDVKSFMTKEIAISPDERFPGSPIPMITINDNAVAQEQATRTKEKKNQEKKKDLQKIVSQSHEMLMSANTSFPMTLFPDTVTVDRTKVTITKRDFFWTSDVLSIRIEDVLNVQASVGPLFGSLTIASRVMSTVDHFKITHLWRADAIRLKHIIQGYVIAQHNKIDTSHLNKRDLIDTLIELGHDTN